MHPACRRALQIPCHELPRLTPRPVGVPLFEAGAQHIYDGLPTPRILAGSNHRCEAYALGARARRRRRRQLPKISRESLHVGITERVARHEKLKTVSPRREPFTHCRREGGVVVGGAIEKREFPMLDAF